MPFFAGLTREEEQDAEEHLKLQLLSLIGHKNEHMYFSEQMKQLINPDFKAKKTRKEDDPAWRPGAENRTKKKRKSPPPPPPASIPPIPCPASPSPNSPDQPPPEVVLSTSLEDFADFF